MGADGKLVLDADGEVYQVNLLEKLLVPLLSKLGNLVIDGGIWLNTQRPEWNDANNALVGQACPWSRCTTCVATSHFCSSCWRLNPGRRAIRRGQQWLAETAAALNRVRPLLGAGPISARTATSRLLELGEAASRYREAIYGRTHSPAR